MIVIIPSVSEHPNPALIARECVLEVVIFNLTGKLYETNPFHCRERNI